jgi:hypothetical protein
MRRWTTRAAPTRRWHLSGAYRRDGLGAVNRLKAAGLKTAGFPVTKTLDSFDAADSSIQPKVFG